MEQVLQSTSPTRSGAHVHPSAPTSSVKPSEWNLAQRIIFRFVCVYLILYSLPAPGRGSLLGVIPGISPITQAYIRMWRARAVGGDPSFPFEWIGHGLSGSEWQRRLDARLHPRLLLRGNRRHCDSSGQSLIETGKSIDGWTTGGVFWCVTRLHSRCSHMVLRRSSRCSLRSRV